MTIDTRDAAVGTYEIDPARSVVTGKTRAMFGLIPVTATFEVQSGTLVIADEPSRSSAAATLHAGSFSSGNAKRDHHIASADFLDAANHPTIRFQSTSVEAAGAESVLRGDLSVRDTTHPVELVISSLRGEGADLQVHATTSVDRHAFGITKAKGMAGGTIALTFDIVAHRV